MPTSWLQDWLKTQPLRVRIVVNWLVAALCVWLAFASGKLAFLLMALVIAAFAFTLDDVRRARAWLGGRE